MSDEVEQAGTRLKELTREVSKLEAQQVVCCSRQLSPGPAHTVAPSLERGTAVNWKWAPVGMFATCAWGTARVLHGEGRGDAQCSPQLPCWRPSIVTCQWVAHLLIQAADHPYQFQLRQASKVRQTMVEPSADSSCLDQHV